MLKITRTNADNDDFRSLVCLLDKELAERNGNTQSFYDPFNKPDHINNVLIAYVDNMPVGCGAIKEYLPDTLEIKRMFVKPEFRGRNIAGTIVKELENWTLELNYSKLILETGKKQIEAIVLYEKAGYTVIENYGQYIGVENSICMKKDLSE